MNKEPATPLRIDNFKSVDFQVLFESTPHPYLILLADLNFTILAVNDCYLEATNTTREEIIGRALFAVFPDNPTDSLATGVSDLRASLERVINKKVQDSMGVQKYDIPQKNSSEFEVRYWSPINTPVFDKNGDIQFIIHRVEDVTEYIHTHTNDWEQERINQVEAEVLRSSQKVKESNRQLKLINKELEKREIELKKMNQKLKEINQFENEFIGNVNHELRTPLTSIRGALGLVIAGVCGELPEKMRNLLEISYKNCERLIFLINDILDLKKIESGNFRLNIDEINVRSFILQAIDLNRAYCDKLKVQILLVEPILNLNIVADSDRLMQVITNLISNAAKFSDEGGQIEIATLELEDRVRISITDHGPGIPDEFRNRVFEKFAQANNTKGKAGSGLGLNISKTIIGQFGGEIGFTSEVNKGSTFYFDLPKSR